MFTLECFALNISMHVFEPQVHPNRFKTDLAECEDEMQEYSSNM